MHSAMKITLAGVALATIAGCGTGSPSGTFKNQGYLQDQNSNVVRALGANVCVRTSDWTPARAIVECDPDLVPKPAPKPAPAPAAAPAPRPAPAAKPAAAPAKPKVLRVTSTELFDFDKAVLNNRAKTLLDTEIIAKLGGFATVQFINVNGHTDRLGSPQYNQKLSEKRAQAVKTYLVSKGVDGSKIETYGFGKTMPVKSCPDQKDRKALKACLEPNRRVEVEVQGTPK